MASIMTVLIGVIVVEHIVLLFLFLINLSYNIPVTILRYTGSKDRPMIIQKKAKKLFTKGVPRLKVKGYKHTMRDFLSKNYYPTPSGKYGGLILWEFEDAMLTPCIPTKLQKKLSAEELERLKQAYDTVAETTGISFGFDEQLHNELRLKAVDDVDVEFMLQDQARIDGQYAGGWRDFITKYAGHMTVIIIAMLMLAGVAIWFDKMPEFASQCFGAAQQAVQSSIIESAAANVAPPG